MKSADKELYPLFSIISFITWLFTLGLSAVFNLVFFRMRVRGREHLRECGEACFAVSNHSLYLDPAVMVFAFAPRRVCMTALSSTVKTRYLGAYLRLLGCMGIDTVGIRSLERRSRLILEKGWFVQVMPEGELRHLADSPGPFREGVFHLAIKLDRPILPYVVRHSPVRIFGHVIHPLFMNLEVEFGPAVHPAQFMPKGSESHKRSSGSQRSSRRAFRDFCFSRIKAMMHVRQ